MLSLLTGWAGKILTIAAAIIAAFLLGKQKGKANEQNRQHRQTRRNLDQAQNTRNDHSAMSDDTVTERLRRRWTRK